MAFDSNGKFNRLYSWKAHAASNIKIRADYHDEEDDGFASGLSTCITKDGKTQPLADIPMNNKHLINLADPRDDAPQDAATKNYVDAHKDFTTGLVISGAGPINGILKFDSDVGVNGIGWDTADMSWIGRVQETDKYKKLLAVNDAVDGTGTDVVRIDEGGRIVNGGALGHNISYDPNNQWRTIGTGIATLMTYQSGVFSWWSQDVAATIAYQPAAVRKFMGVTNSNGTTALSLHKVDGTANKAVTIDSYAGSSLRYRLVMGAGEAEGSTADGSNFYLQSFANDGATVANEIIINRASHLMTTAGALTTGGNITSNTGHFIGAGANMVIGNTSGNGAMYFRPYTYNNAYGEMTLDYNGNLALCGALAAATGGIYMGKGHGGKFGQSGAYDGHFHNLYYAAGFEYVLVGDTNMGAITWQSDYRIKRHIQPLGSMWEKVKSLNPVRYNHAKFREFTVDDDVERWGMLAHELQEKLVDSAAFGHKDEDNVIQSINPLTVITALTKALQEAMARIEALEARAPA